MPATLTYKAGELVTLRSGTTMPHQARILLNAEPFGFGPSAAIASIAPLLIKAGAEVSYIGEGHTLDLQKPLAYNDIYDISDLDEQSRRRFLAERATSYDYFFTAMDFTMAELAQSAGLKTIIYDALTWYWPTINPAIKKADMYIAQNFFGVTERLRNNAGEFTRSATAAPIIQAQHHTGQKKHVLLNLGGLQNPFWEFDDTVSYARMMMEAVRQALPEHENLVVATSSKVAAVLDDPSANTYSRKDMLALLAHAKYAIMTPGLGNIYDAASFNIPTVWLPPANDSQGQQTQVLAKNDCCDAYLDWSELTQDHHIDYKTSQIAALKAITAAVKHIEQRAPLRQALSTTMSEKVKEVSACTDSKSRKLIQLFGDNGAEDIAAIVLRLIKEEAYARTK